jgi:hypothetical protein
MIRKQISAEVCRGKKLTRACWRRSPRTFDSRLHTLHPLVPFPLLQEGETAEKRDGMRSFLQRRQYRIGRATIDASDWAISWRLEKRLAGAPKMDTTPYGEFFKQHLLSIEYAHG